MARSASTSDISEQIAEKLKSGNCKTFMVLEYYDSGVWRVVSDLDAEKGITINKSAKKYKYANYALTPIASTINFMVLDKDGKYSEGSGTSVAGIFDLDTKVRVRGGYILPGLDTGTESATLNGTNAHTYFMEYDTGVYIKPDSDNGDGNENIHFTDLFLPLYDSETYDDSTYSSDCYYVYSFDLYTSTKGRKVTSFAVTSNSATGTVYWRYVDNLVDAEDSLTLSQDWSEGGTTVNGTATFWPEGQQYKRYLQVGVVYDGIAWEDDIQLTDITISYQDVIEWVYYDVFYLDSPSFSDPPLPAYPTISCSGRDPFKRVIEEDINLPDVSGKAIDTIVKDLCDRIGIKYTGTSIANLFNFGLRTLATGLTDQVKVIDIFENCMQVLNKEGYKYQAYMEYDSALDDMVLYIQPVPSLYAADFVFSWKKYQSLGSRRKNYDKLLKRITCITDIQTVDAEVQLATATYTTAGLKILTWSGEAEYKRLQVSRTSADDSNITISQVNPESIHFHISGTPVGVTITAFGNKWSSTAPTYEGEAIHFDNMENSKGLTARIENLLAISDDECRDVAKGFIDKFGLPVWESQGLTYPYLNLMLEQNDMTLVWAKNLFVDDLFYITGLTLHWDMRSAPGDSTSFNLDDSGKNFSDEGNFIYDRDGAPVNGTVIQYNKGFVYDMRFGPNATDAEIEAGTTLKYNVTFS